MPVYLIGGDQPGGVPFDQLFFTSHLGDLVGQVSGNPRVTLHLTDGVEMDLCEIVSTTPRYIVVRGYREGEEACELDLHVIPYGLIYRVRVAPKADDDRRVGFRWKPSSEH
jgi:hypothetical protein